MVIIYLSNDVKIEGFPNGGLVSYKKKVWAGKRWKVEKRAKCSRHDWATMCARAELMEVVR